MLAFAQREIVTGRVYYGSLGMKDVLVVNNSAQIETRTDSLGNFKIKAQVGDLLIISDYTVETKKIRYTPDLIKNSVLLIEVKQALLELDEVEVTGYNFSAYKMGLTSKEVILPSVAQRRMVSSGGGPVGMLINLITGQHRVLKNALEIEKREVALDRLNYMLEDVFYIEELKLHKEQVEGFKYYAAEDEKLRDLLKLDDEGQLKFALAELARQFTEINKP